MDNKNRERDFHDDWAKSEDLDKIDVRKNNEVCTAPEMRYITKKLGNLKNKTLLDIGCGLGEASVYFSMNNAIVTASDLSEQIGATTFNLYVSLLGIIFLTVGFILPLGFEMDLPLTKTGIFAIFANGIFYISSWVLFFKGARIIGATRSSMLACIEPLFAALLAIILLKQILSVTEWIGFFIVLTAIYTFEKNSTKTEAKSKS